MVSSFDLSMISEINFSKLNLSNKKSIIVKELSESELFLKQMESFLISFGQIQNNVNNSSSLAQIKQKLKNNSNFTNEYEEIMNKNTKFNCYLENKTKLHIYLSKLKIVKEIDFEIINNKKEKSIYKDKINKTEAKSISLKLQNNVSNKSKNVIVKENECSFSDDSVDLEMIPKLCINKNNNKTDYNVMKNLKEIIESSKNETEINQKIKKKTDSLKVRNALEGDLKSILLLAKYLKLHEN